MGLSELWKVWEVQFLLLLSLLVQVLLLIFTEWHRRASWALLSEALNAILWLLYQMADDIGIYVLGHMALSSKPHEQQQLMAFWASLLLVHLGGQDTITAYAIEDNNLWLRHLLTLVVQAAGVAYVLYKYVGGGSRALLAAAVLMFLVGFVKYCERIYALYSSNFDSIRKFLDGFQVPEADRNMEYPVPADLDDEVVLQGAHDLLHICIGQFVDYKVWPSKFQTGAIMAYCEATRTDPDGTTTIIRGSKLLELVVMQLSLMRDILFTKSAVIHTRYGCVSRVVSTVSTILAFHWFQQSMAGGSYSKKDIVVTYILLGGAFLLEGVAMLRAAGSTWTCTWLRAAGWDRVHAVVVYLRRCVKEAHRCRKWSGSIRQRDLLEHHRRGKSGACYMIASCIGLEQQWNSLCFFNSAVITHDLEGLLLGEVQRMVEVCGEDFIRGPKGNTILGRHKVGAWGTIRSAAAAFYVGIDGVDEIGFDGSILAWHYATAVLVDWIEIYCMEPFLGQPPVEVPTHCSYMYQRVQGMSREHKERTWGLAKAIRTLSRYMLFLLAERPHLLPSQYKEYKEYDSFCAQYKEFSLIRSGDRISDVIRPAVDLAINILAKCHHQAVDQVLRVVSRVWVEMLCYSVSHSNNYSHARQLSGGTELITVTWILTTALYIRYHHDKDPMFLQEASNFLERHERKIEKESRMRIF